MAFNLQTKNPLPIGGTDNGDGSQSLAISGNITASNPSVSTNGAAIPTSGTLAAGKDTSGNLQPLKVGTDGTLNVSGSFTASSPSVGLTGATAPTSADQIGGVDNTGKLQALVVSANGLKVDGSAVTQPVSGTVGISGTVPVSGSVSVSNFPSTQPVSATSLPLPSNAAQETGGNLASISTSVGRIPAQGTALTAASMPVNVASDQTLNVTQPDIYVIGQAAQTATVNNILTTTAGTNATDLAMYKSFSVQIVSTGTGGTYIFEGSNDNVNFQAVPIVNQAQLNVTPASSAITATASQIIYTGSVTFRYFRLRIATAITGGSIQAFSRFSQSTWTPTVLPVAQNTGANLVASISAGTITTVSTVTAVTTVASVTSDQLAIPGAIADVASAALTTTTTTATLTPTFGVSYVVSIPVTVVSGTTPTLDVQIQESDDTGTNWYSVYDFPRITATGMFRSPPLLLRGNRIRYVQTVGGTTPSFTRAINRLQSSNALPSAVTQLIDRTIVLTTLSSTTPTLVTQGSSNLRLVVNIGAATTPPALQIQCSDDAGATFYNVGSPLTAVASSTVQATVTGLSCQMSRVIVTTAGNTVTAGYVLLKAF